MLFQGFPLWAVALLTSAVLAAPSSSTKEACEKLDAANPEGVTYPLSLDYIGETSTYWSHALRQIKPACIVAPKSAREVAAAVKTLKDYPDVKFAVKSGGHDPNPGHASVKDGVLISMKDLTGATYDKDEGVVYVRPGGEWNDVVGTLDPQGVTVLGGRMGVVGVGGLLLQGGLSFLSTQHGLAADNIVGWETVTADGKIVYVNATESPELAVAMRGSGSQFGIVTEFTVKAHQIGKVWGGIRFYDASKADDIFAILHDFVPNTDDKAAIILTNLYLPAGTRGNVILYFYDGPEPPTEGPFAELLKVTPLSSTTKTQSYSSLLKGNGQLGDASQARQSFRSYTIPYVADAPEMYGEIVDKFGEILKSYLLNPLHIDSQCSLDFQPLPAIVGNHSEAAGGNAMGLKGSDPDRIVILTQCATANALNDDELFALAKELTDWIDAKIPDWTGGEKGYLPLFMNDAFGGQNVTGSYEGYAEFKALQEEVDPEGFWKTRGGGFTY